MKKKGLSIVIALVCAIFCTFGFTACSNDDDIGDIFYLTLNDDGESYSVSGLLERETKNLVIPATYKGKPVTAIAKRAFRDNKFIENITVSENIRSISSDAFSYCSSIKTITVSDKNPVYHSADNCLIETESKTMILGCRDSVIPNDGSVTSIGAAFSGNALLDEITIPNSVTTIGKFAFFECISLFTVKIENGVTSIGESAFAQCNSITRLTIPENVTEIAVYAFNECSRLREVTFENPYGWKAYLDGVIADNIRELELTDPAIAAERLVSIAAYSLKRT